MALTKALGGSGASGTGRFWDVTAIPTDAAVQTSRTLDFADPAASLTGFAWVNQGSATAAIQRKRLFLTAPSNGGASHSKRLYTPPSANQLPTAPWCVQVPVTLYATVAFSMAGIYIKNTANGKGLGCHLLNRSDVGKVYALNVVRMTNETTASGADLFNDAAFASGVLAVGFDGTTFSFYASPDGRDWSPAANVTDAAASHIGAGGTYSWNFVVDSFASRASGGAFNNSVILNQATPVPHGQLV